MTCPKCRGLMLDEYARDEDAGLIGRQWRCLNCSTVKYAGPIKALVPAVDRLAAPPAPGRLPSSSPLESRKFLVQNPFVKAPPLVLRVEGNGRREASNVLSHFSYEKSCADRETEEAKQRRRAWGRAYYWRKVGFTEAEIVVLEASYQARGGKARWGNGKVTA